MIMAAAGKLGLITPTVKASVYIPGINITGWSLVYFSIGIVIAALVHELSHAYTAIVHGIPVKGMGFAFILVLPIAFTEIEEDIYKKSSLRGKILTLIAGPASNTCVALLVMILIPFIISAPGLTVIDVEPNGPADKAGLKPYTIILRVNNEPATLENLQKYIKKVNETVEISLQVWSDNGVQTINVTKPTGYTRIGIIITGYIPSTRLVKILGVSMAIHTVSLIQWIYIINFSLALINIAPLFITDGGKIAYEIFRNKNISHIINTATLALLIIALAPIP